MYALLTSGGLEQYYALRGSRGVPVPDAHVERRDVKWLEVIARQVRDTTGIARVDLDVQGLHCSACVWLIDTLFRRRPGAVTVQVNTTLGRAQLLVRSTFDVGAFVTEVERFGYLFGPPHERARPRTSAIVPRMGVCIAIAMNTMIFAIATYAGLREGPLYATFERLNILLSLVSVLLGGPVFFRSAWQALRRGVLHLDLPISLGIVLAFASSTWAWLAGRGGGVYVDTLNVFIALMLVGRWLQERVLERNRLALLDNDGVDGLLTRRVREGRVETLRCAEVVAGDTLLLAPGDLVPVDVVCARTAAFSLDWINGESRARTFDAGAVVPAGAFQTGMQALEAVARTDFAVSPLQDLLRTPLSREPGGVMASPWWSAFARRYVILVLVAASVGFAIWAFGMHDVPRAIEVAAAVLIVTCPCAFGIATPLAYDLAQAGLRRAGLFVRAPGFLDRAASVHTVVFDKTGTVTTGILALRDGGALSSLARADLEVLSAMVSRSSHPKSIAIARALAPLGIPFDPLTLGVTVSEEAGAGLTWARDGVTYRLGAPAWAARGGATGDVAFARDGVVLADLTTEEALRPDAKREIAELVKEGYAVWLLSGDDPARVAQTAREVGLDTARAIGGCAPQAKAAWVAAHDRGDLLMIGDGINDSLVVASAFCSGTPAIDRPFMPARADFYFVTPGLRPIRLALRAASTCAQVRRRNLALALAYNVLTVSLAWAGLMSPVLCAVLMPASSLTTIAATMFALSARSPLWKFSSFRSS